MNSEEGDLNTELQSKSKEELIAEIIRLQNKNSVLESFNAEKIQEKIELITREQIIELKTSNTKLEQEIIERKKIEQELIRVNKDLEMFAYLASHDLQEPLRMVSSYTMLLEKRYKDKLDKEAMEFIQFAVEGATRMKNLIDDLLDYSQISSFKLETAPQNLNDLVKRVISNIKPLIDENNVRINYENLPIINVAPVHMVQLLQNLISNAIKYHGKIIDIKAEEREKDWLFSVSDNGMGIDHNYFERIFLIFQRLNGRAYPGTGMGLSICKKIIESYNGKIWVESELGNGSTFYFTLPV